MRLLMLSLVGVLTACATMPGAEAPEPKAAPADAPEAAEEATEAVWDYDAHVAQRTAEIESAGVERGGVLFVGDSITYGGGDWSRWFPGVVTSNQGIGGDRTAALLGRMTTITRGTPERVFLMIGTNDLSGGLSPEEAAMGAIDVARGIRAGIPGADLYVQSILPREAAMTEAVRAVNARLAAAAGEVGYTYLDIFGAFAAPDGTLRSDLTEDDLHLTDEGYALWADLIDVCVREGCQGL